VDVRTGSSAARLLFALVVGAASRMRRAELRQGTRKTEAYYDPRSAGSWSGGILVHSKVCFKSSNRLWWRLADENAVKKLSSRRRLRSGGQNRMLQPSEPCFKTFAGPAGKRKLPSGNRPFHHKHLHGLAPASHLFLQSVPKPDERSKVSKIEQTRCDRS